MRYQAALRPDRQRPRCGHWRQSYMGHPLGLQAITDHNSLCSWTSAGLQPVRMNCIEDAGKGVVWAHVAVAFSAPALTCDRLRPRRSTVVVSQRCRHSRQHALLCFCRCKGALTLRHAPPSDSRARLFNHAARTAVFHIDCGEYTWIRF